MSRTAFKNIHPPAAFWKYRKKSCGKSGFTLLELMVVLLLVALLAGVTAPAIGRFMNNLNFREQTANILASLRYARLMAITNGQQVSVTLDDSNGRIVYLSGAVTEEKVFDMAEDASFTLDPPEIVFYPEGQATPATLTSERGGRIVRYIMDPLTALPIPAPASE